MTGVETFDTHDEGERVITRRPGRGRAKSPLWAAVCLALLAATLPPRAMAQEDELWSLSGHLLERRIVDALASGGDATALLEEARRRAASLAGDALSAPPRGNETSEINRTLGALKSLADRARDPEASQPSNTELLAAYDDLRAADLLLRERLRFVRSRVEAVASAADALRRLADVQGRYEEKMAALLEPMAGHAEVVRRALHQADERLEEAPVEERDRVSPAAAAGARSGLLTTLMSARQLLDEATEEPERPALRAGLLPFRQTRFGARSPITEPAITPSYAQLVDPVPAPEDRAGGSQTTLSDPILLKAEELGYDYVAIYEFVQSQIEVEWYSGAMKGAEETLTQSAGNDVDQASLLIALLRAGGVPARYVHGVIRAPIAALADDFGLSTATEVTTALSRAGVAYSPVIQGGSIGAVDLEHTWVSARVPYSNYRGAVVDFSGETWVPLAPALKEHARTPARRILEEMEAAGEFSPTQAVGDYLATAQVNDPLTVLRNGVLDFLAVSEPDTDLEDLFGSRSIVPAELGLLPSTLPFEVVAVTDESAELGDDRLHKVRITVFSGEGQGSAEILSYEAPLADLTNRRVTMSYLPATVDDQRVTNSFGGIGLVPLYLIQLRPQVKVDGRPKAVGEMPIDAGVLHRMEIALVGPFGEERVAVDLVSGSYYAVGLGAQRTQARLDDGTSTADTEYLAARLLSQLALSYGEQWDAAERELADLFDVALVRPLSTVAVTSNLVGVETLLGLPEQIRWEGVGLDAALRVTEPQSRADTIDAANWMEWAALHGSALEHFVFERSYLVEGISADKGLALARDAGIEVLTLDSTNVAAELPGLSHPDSVKGQIDNWVRLGNSIEVPRSEVSVRSWTGSVWRAIDPESRGAGYFISGGLAGGSTTESAPQWLLDFLAEAFSSPYSAESGEDPLAGVEIVKIPGGDEQEGVVGEVLPQSLRVMVRDAEGRPVKNAQVVFGVTTPGDAEIRDDTGLSGSQITTLTDELGVASVKLKLGTKTDVDPVYVRRESGDEFVTLASFYFIEAVATSAFGPLLLDDPFRALALPGEPATLTRTDPFVNPSVGGTPASWSDAIFVVVEDEFGNRVSNEEVTFSVGPMEIPSECPNIGENPMNAVVFDNSSGPDGNFVDCPNRHPVLGECGEPSLTRTTNTRGTSAGVILGNSTVSTYSVDVGSGSLDPLMFSYEQLFAITPQGVCDRSLGVRVLSSTLVDENGNPVAATRPGERWPIPISFTIQYPEIPFTVEFVISQDGEVFFFRQDKTEVTRWLRVAGEVSSSSTNFGDVTQPVFQGDETYEFKMTSTGLLPGRNDAEVSVVSVTAPVTRVDSGNGGISTMDEVLAIGAEATVDTIFSVDPKIDGTDPTPIVVTQSGQSTEAVAVEYTIEPPEYSALRASIDFFEDGNDFGSAVANSDQGSGQATIQRGVVFDFEKTYEAQVVLNRGSVAEVRGDKAELEIRKPIFDRLPGNVNVDLDVDLLNERVCSIGSSVTFSLIQEAEVTLKFTKIEAQDTDGNPVFGSDTVIIDGEILGVGERTEAITPVDLLPGTYRMSLSGISTSDGYMEEHLRGANSEFRTRDSLPVGHAIVRNVDLWDGHLGLRREDFSVPARGGRFGFNRSYSSNAGNTIGPLGAGWSHNWDSKVVVNRCGEFIVIGGGGSGMRFVANAEGGFDPLKGYHGSLALAEGGPGVDFYTKNGTRYHYGLPFKQNFFLEFVEDPNGNRRELTYQTDLAQGPRLISVTGPSGRLITFAYEDRNFEFEQAKVITTVTGPDGLGMNFQYDAIGNLVSAARTGGARSESYTYPMEGATLGSLIDQRHLMTSVTNDVNGATTSYEFMEGVIRATAEVVAPSTFYTRVTAAEGGNYSFAYDLAGLESRGPPTLLTTVNDPVGGTTTYELNQYGSTTRITDAAGGTTGMTWAADDVVMLSRTDANGVLSTFDYDDDGNILTETVAGQTRTFDYVGMGSFSPPFIKTKVSAVANRNGVTTNFSYDGSGNLTSETVGGLTTTHTYSGNGDRLSTTDPRGMATSFGYDGYGNLTRVTDAEGGVTRVVADARGRTTSQTDPLGRRTTISYDGLDREVSRTRPRGATEQSIYEDASNTFTRIDAEGRSTRTVYDLEGRVIDIRNPEGATKEIEYDPAGRKTRETNFFGAGTPVASTTFTTDGVGRVLTKTEPLGRVTSLTYDGVGNVLSQTLSGTGGSRTITNQYDDLNRTIRITQQNSSGDAVTLFAYDGEGNKTQQTDPLGRVTTFDYDDLNRVTSVQEPLGRTTLLTYDGIGNVVQEQRLGGASGTQTRSFAYDGLNRLTEQTDAEGNKTLFEYDRAGNLIREIDPMLNAVSHRYDDLDQRIETSRTASGLSIVTVFDNDKVGNITRQTLPNGNVINNSYDELDRLTSSSDSMGSLLQATYDSNGNVLTQTDANGNLTSNTYDLLNRLTSQVLTAGRTKSFTYDAAGNRLSETDPNGNTTSFEYDQLNRLTRIDLPLGLSESFTYDAVGNKTSETDRNGNTTTFEYDDLNQVTLIVGPSPLSLTTTFTNDAQGNRLTETSPRGVVTRFEYDDENRLTQTTKAGLVIERIQYDPNGNGRFVTDANGNIIGFEYDERNLVVAQNKPLASITSVERDEMGDVVEITDPEGRVSRFTHDLRQRRLTSTNGASETTEFAYDGNGNRTSVMKPEGNTSTFVYDDADRLTSAANPLTETTTYGYDLNGNNTSQTDARNNTTTLEYDDLNRVTAKELPGGARESYQYDGNGNLTLLTDANGQIISSDYDVEDRETTRDLGLPLIPTGNDLLSIETVYDEAGNPTELREIFSGATGTRVTTQAFDDFDRLTRVTNADGRTLSYVYDPNGNRTRLTDADGRVTTYTFDALNRPFSAAISGVGITEYEYFRDDRLRRTRYPNATEAVNTYDAAGRTSEIRNLLGASVLSSYQYDFDRNGNRIQQVELNGGAAETTTYLYDGADRLLTVAYPDQTVTYTHDGVGNRLTELAIETATGTTLTSKSFSYDNRNQLTSIVDDLDPSQNVAYTFDLNGNQSNKIKDGVETVFTYDVRDQLVEVREDGSLTGSYLYDYQGLRVAKRAGTGSTIRYVYDDRSVLMQTDNFGATIAKYDYGADRLLSLAHQTEGRQFYLFDGLRSASTLTDVTGSVTARYQYDAWGNFRAQTGSSSNPFQFTGFERDGETGLYYAKARFYDPEVGRFLSEDPFAGDLGNPPSLHKYLYAFGNPTVFVDPSGELALIQEFRENTFDETQDFLDEGLDSLQDDNGFVRVFGGIGIGLLKGAVAVGDKAVGAVNAVANVGVLVLPASDEIREEAALEIDGTVQGVKVAVNGGVAFATLVIEDPTAADAQVAELVNVVKAKVAETATRVSMGDARAIGELTSGVVQVVAELAIGGKGTGGAARGSATATTRAGQIAKQVVENARLATARATQVATRASRTAARATVGGIEKVAGATVAAAQVAARATRAVARSTRNVVRRPVTRSRVRSAVAQSRQARASSNFAEFAARERALGAGSRGGGPGVPRAGGGGGGVPPGRQLQTFFPPNRGFLGPSERIFLEQGQLIDRVGSDFGKFFSPAGTPIPLRALPPGSASKPLSVFRVLKPFEVDAGTIAPAFNQIGLGTQFVSPVSVRVLLKRGIIERVEP